MVKRGHARSRSPIVGNAKVASNSQALGKSRSNTSDLQPIVMSGFGAVRLGFHSVSSPLFHSMSVTLNASLPSASRGITFRRTVSVIARSVGARSMARRSTFILASSGSGLSLGARSTDHNFSSPGGRPSRNSSAKRTCRYISALAYTGSYALIALSEGDVSRLA